MQCYKQYYIISAVIVIWLRHGERHPGEAIGDTVSPAEQEFFLWAPWITTRNTKDTKTRQARPKKINAPQEVDAPTGVPNSRFEKSIE